MAETPTNPGLPLRELDGPLARAREVARQHSASAPDGGTGPGHHLTFSEGLRWYMDTVLLTTSPGAYLARHMMRNWPRYQHVLAALALSGDEAKQLIIAETGATVEAVLGGLLPGLLDIAKWVGLGAVIGGGIGALGGPADEITVPGGALAGAEIGLWIANSLGLAGLLVGMVQNLGQFVVYATGAAEVAWFAGDDPHVPLHTDEVTASKLFAAAIAELWMALLTALVFEVMKRAAEAAHGQLKEGATREALNDVAKKLSESKLGDKAGDWFRNNFEKIREAVKKHQEQRQRRLEQGNEGGQNNAQDQGQESTKRNESSSPNPKNPSELLAERRRRLGLPPAGSPEDSSTLSILKINDKTYEGINSGNQNPSTPMSLDRVNAQTLTHAEADAVQKAVNDGAAGTADSAEMWVDRDPCRSCGQFGGLRSLARNLGVQTLTVNSPSGAQVFTPTK